MRTFIKLALASPVLIVLFYAVHHIITLGGLHSSGDYVLAIILSVLLSRFLYSLIGE